MGDLELWQKRIILKNKTNDSSVHRPKFTASGVRRIIKEAYGVLRYRAQQAKFMEKGDWSLQRQEGQNKIIITPANAVERTDMIQNEKTWLGASDIDIFETATNGKLIIRVVDW